MAVFVRVEGGPHLGLLPVETPLPATIALGVCEGWARDDGPRPFAYAVYALEHQSGEPVYVFREYDRAQHQPLAVESPGDLPQSNTHAPRFAHEDRLEDAIKDFYANPNYDIYTTKPTDRHPQVLVQVGHRRAHVDTGIADVIRELFRLGLDTIGSCQEGAKGEPFEGHAYIGFCRERDAIRFYNLLAAGGIAATFKPKKLKIWVRRTPGTPPEDQIESPAGNVIFSSCEIDRVAQILRSETP